MTRPDPTHLARCRCEAVEIGAWGKPIVVTACHCNDCRAAAERVAACADPPSAPGVGRGTEFMLFRRDRMACTRGADRLAPLRLTDASRTRRMIAGCCATPMYLAFDDRRPWVSAFRAAFGPDAPPVRMRICTGLDRSEGETEDGLPNHRSYPPAMMIRILAAWPGMLWSRPLGRLP